MNKKLLSGNHFYQLIKEQTPDLRPYYHVWSINPEHLNYDFGLYQSVVQLVNFLSGYSTSACNSTVVPKVLSKLNSVHFQRLIENTTKNMCDWKAREYCYHLIKSLHKI